MVSQSFCTNSFFKFRFAVCMFFQANTQADGFFFTFHAMVFLNFFADYMGKRFRVGIHKTNRAKILYGYDIFKFRRNLIIAK